MKLFLPLLLLFVVPTQMVIAQRNNSQNAISLITTKTDLKLHVEKYLQKGELPQSYARSVIALGVNKQGYVIRATPINHPYSEAQEKGLIKCLSSTKWTSLEGINSFYVVLEIQGGNVKVDFNRAEQ